MTIMGHGTINAKDGVTNADDYIIGGGGDDRIFGLGGDDNIVGDLGSDFIDGGPDTDTANYHYSRGAVGVVLTDTEGFGFGGEAEGDTLVSIENLFGSRFNDYLAGNTGRNVLNGNEGDDILKGGGGADTLNGGDALIIGGSTFVSSGNDTLKGGGGGDTLNGGEDIDTAAYNDSPAGVYVSLRLDDASGGDATDDELNDIENITGSAHIDTLEGNDEVGNVLNGMDGVDVLRGLGNNDTLYGGNNDDTLDGGTGIDNMVGGAHNDTYIVDNLHDRVTELAGEGMDVVRTSGNWTMTRGAEVERLETMEPGGAMALILEGNEFGNTIVGNDGDNGILGGGGADEMIGRRGNDTYYVDNVGDSVRESAMQGDDAVWTSVTWTLTPGADVETLRTNLDFGFDAIDLTGNASGNVVRGNYGNNRISGGGGRDTLTGLFGEDSFQFATPLVDPITMVVDPFDTITDFNVVDDTIQLEDMVFAAFATGPLADDRFVLGTAPLDANDNILYDNTTGALFYDSDGNRMGAMGAMPVQFAQLTGAPALTHLDFIIV
jgi:Ca2+-binding RTX toxin-like protein